jgi:hypothetical protein
MKKNKNDFELVFSERQSFLSILNRLKEYLKNASLNHQAQVVQKVIDLLYLQNFDQFVKLINSVDMWGGSGAVWEVYIENKEQTKSFEKDIINLIDLMEKTNILGNGIRRIRKIFKDNLKLKQ